MYTFSVAVFLPRKRYCLALDLGHEDADERYPNATQLLEPTIYEALHICLVLNSANPPPVNVKMKRLADVASGKSDGHDVKCKHLGLIQRQSIIMANSTTKVRSHWRQTIWGFMGQSISPFGYYAAFTRLSHRVHIYCVLERA